MHRVLLVFSHNLSILTASVWMGTNQFSDGRDATVTRREGPESMQYYEQLEPTASPRKDERWGPEVYRYEDHPLHLMV